MTTSDALGNYSLTIQTNGESIDGFLKATKTGYKEYVSLPAVSADGGLQPGERHHGDADDLIIAAPWIEGDKLRLDHMLAVQPATQWLTLLFQVMPVFFLVGGYSNAASWDAARRSGTPYGRWVAGRARRLIGPIIPLILVWAAMAFVFRRFGVSYEMIRHASILALVPMWFLAVSTCWSYCWCR